MNSVLPYNKDIDSEPNFAMILDAGMIPKNIHIFFKQINSRFNDVY